MLQIFDSAYEWKEGYLHNETLANTCKGHQVSKMTITAGQPEDQVSASKMPHHDAPRRVSAPALWPEASMFQLMLKCNCYPMTRYQGQELPSGKQKLVRAVHPSP